MSIEKYKKQIEEIVSACHYVAGKGLTSSSGGNLSLRMDDGAILITPTGVPKERILFEDICVVDSEGKTLYAPEGVKPTSETPFHTMIMRRRADVKAVVHAHPVVLSAFSIVRSRLLEYPFFPEEAMEVGPIVMVPYEEPSCDKLATRLAEYIHISNGFLLENHGAVVVSQKSMADAAERMNMMEAVADSVLKAHQLGDLKFLTRGEVSALEELKIIRGMADQALPISKSFRFEDENRGEFIG